MFLLPKRQVASGTDASDLECRERLSVTGLAPVVLPPAELEDDDLLAAILSDDLRFDLRSTDERRADLHSITAADEKHVTQSDGVANIARELLDTKLVALCDAILLSACLDHRIHGSPSFSLAPPDCSSASLRIDL